MAKKKSATFKYEGEGSVTVALPGREPMHFESGDSVTTDEPAVIEALSANPDLTKGKGKS